jgi:hypothetical protein
MTDLREFRTKPNPDQPGRCPSIDPHDELQCARAIHEDDACSFGVVFCSGREDTARAETALWIAENVEVPGELWMRAAGDRRRDSIVKRELFDVHIRNRYAVRYVLDDRQQVVDMWRSLGLTCMQVARGDF